MRVLYVSLTRAESCLILSTKGNSNVVNELSKFDDNTFIGIKKDDTMNSCVKNRIEMKKNERKLQEKFMINPYKTKNIANNNNKYINSNFAQNEINDQFIGENNENSTLLTTGMNNPLVRMIKDMEQANQNKFNKITTNNIQNPNNNNSNIKYYNKNNRTITNTGNLNINKKIYDESKNRLTYINNE